MRSQLETLIGERLKDMGTVSSLTADWQAVITTVIP